MAYADLTPEQRKRRNRSNQASIRRYDAANYAKITIRIRRDGNDGFTPEELHERAQRDGLSLSAWIASAIREKMEHI